MPIKPNASKELSQKAIDDALKVHEEHMRLAKEAFLNARRPKLCKKRKLIKSEAVTPTHGQS